jgi:uncharacterized membrane protein YphA (DoxX/SURF4 family)
MAAINSVARMMKKNSGFLNWSFTFVRILIGWHFLFEGIVKLFNPDWSSASFLIGSGWLFSGFFHWLAGNHTALGAVDFLNTWGLLLIGTSLFLGVFTRIAGISGVLLLLLYYIASPPFAYSPVPSTSHFYLINYNLIEAVVLLGIISFPKDYLISLQKLYFIYHEKRKEQKFPSEENHGAGEGRTTSRRELIKNLAVVPFFGAVFFGMAKKRGWISYEEKVLTSGTDSNSGATLLTAGKADIRELKEEVPKGTIKNISLSRIIAGGNLISGFAHARDLLYVSSWLKTYFTDEKVIETLWLCEACGINTAILRTDEDTIRILGKYRKRGGKIQWIAQTYPQRQDISNIKLAVDNGAIGALVQGNIADQIIREGRIEDMVKPIDFIKSQGLIAGTAGHSLTVPVACIENGIPVDFLMKTYHHSNYWSATEADNGDPYLPKEGNLHQQAHDNIWCMQDVETAAFFKNVSIPWIAYKVLAAGAIKPSEGLRHAFSGGADFACLGMFDFQVVENANTVCEVLNSDLKRERTWFA